APPSRPSRSGGAPPCRPSRSGGAPPWLSFRFGRQKIPLASPAAVAESAARGRRSEREAVRVQSRVPRGFLAVCQSFPATCPLLSRSPLRIDAIGAATVNPASVVPDRFDERTTTLPSSDATRNRCRARLTTAIALTCARDQCA